MSNGTFSIEHKPLLATLHQWEEEQESLDAQWNESLEALVAFQSHLDAWQQELVQERDELREARETWDRELAEADQKGEQASAETAAQLAEARATLAQQVEQLQARVEELRALEQQRADAVAELEQARAHADQLQNELDRQRQEFEHARATTADEMRQLQAQRDARAEAATSDSGGREIGGAASGEAPLASVAPPARVARTSANGCDAKRQVSSPVLGSIVEQFGKLRQQRTSERQAGKKKGN